MSRGEKSRSIDVCLYFCHNSLCLMFFALPYHLVFLFSFVKFLFSFPLCVCFSSSLLPSPLHSWLLLSLLYLLEFMGFLPFVLEAVLTILGFL